MITQMNWKELEERAYVPYSKTSKVCIIRGESGSFYPGVRVENVSFPITIPAVQAACCICLAEGDVPKELIVKSDKELEQLQFWVKEFDLKITTMPELEDIKFSDPGLEISQKDIKPALVSLLDKAITIHSDFPVSALLFCKQGIISGSNVEVSEWTKGLCAERLAIAKALSYGFNTFEWMSLHTLKGEFSSPCGACRQVIHEHMPDNQIDFNHADGTLSTHYTGDLLPFSFSSTSLIK
jgi:homotetrameric cytidine deaminase